MPQLTAITRYPVKGLGPDPLTRITLAPAATLPLDRAFAIENGPSPFNDAAPGHVKKKHFLMLAGQAELARLSCRFDEKAGRFSVQLDDQPPIEITLDRADTHAPLFTLLRELLGDAVRGELRLVHAPGRAMTDIPEPQISLINAASLRDLSGRVGQALDPVRMRGNLLIDGAAPWAELDWVGQDIRIGPLTCRVENRIRRCAATSVNPGSARRDLDLPAALFGAHGHMDCGVYLTVLDGGEIALGDTVTPATG